MSLCKTNGPCGGEIFYPGAVNNLGKALSTKCQRPWASSSTKEDFLSFSPIRVYVRQVTSGMEPV